MNHRTNLENRRIKELLPKFHLHKQSQISWVVIKNNEIESVEYLGRVINHRQSKTKTTHLSVV